VKRQQSSHTVLLLIDLASPAPLFNQLSANIPSQLNDRSCSKDDRGVIARACSRWLTRTARALLKSPVKRA